MWSIKTCNGYGIIHFGFNLPNGALFGKRKVSKRVVFRFIMTDFIEHCHNGFGGYYNVFMQINNQWKAVQISILNSELARQLSEFLHTYKGKLGTHHMPISERSPYKGLSHMLPKEKSANYDFNIIRRRPLDTDNADKPSGTVNPYCWNAMYKNEPQVGYKPNGEIVKKGSYKFTPVFTK